MARTGSPASPGELASADHSVEAGCLVLGRGSFKRNPLNKTHPSSPLPIDPNSLESHRGLGKLARYAQDFWGNLWL